MTATTDQSHSSTAADVIDDDSILSSSLDDIIGELLKYINFITLIFITRIL